MPIGPCPCGSKRSYVVCCEPLHHGKLAASAEALMRSRYSAYVLKLEDYLLASWHPDTRPEHLGLSDDMQWRGLKVKAHQVTGPNTATVHFVARYRNADGMQQIQELSRFERHDGHWLYIDGDVSGF